MKKKKFVAIIGHGRSGKSTIIQSFTGCGGKAIGEFADFGIYIMNNLRRTPPYKMYVIPNSPQEDYRLGLAQLAQVFNRAVGDNECLGIVMAIRPNRPRKRIRMEQVFNLVQEIGRFEISLFVLNPGRNGNVVTPESITGRLNLGIQPISLNALDFAYFNARIIQERTNILPDD